MSPGYTPNFLDDAKVTMGKKRKRIGVGKPTKIMFLSSCVRGGGAGWSLYYLLKHIDRNAVEPLVVIPTTGIFEKRFEDLGIQVVIPRGMPERAAQLREAV